MRRASRHVRPMACAWEDVLPGTRFDIHGFNLFLEEGPASAMFAQEFGRFSRVVSEVSHSHLEVTLGSAGESYPNRPSRNSDYGIRMPTSAVDDRLIYHPRCPSEFVLALTEGYLSWPDKTLVHAGAVAGRTNATLILGAGNIGKTSTVLRAIKCGYRYLADDWAVIGNGNVYPFPKRLRIFDYNIALDPDIAQRVLPGHKAKVVSLWFHARREATRRVTNRYVRAAFALLRLIYPTDIEALFPGSLTMQPFPIGHAVLLERSNVSTPAIRSITPEQLANRMTAIGFHERASFWRHYHLACFVSGTSDRLSVGDAYVSVRETMELTFAQVETVAVTIPNGFSPPETFDVLTDQKLIE